MYKRQAKDHGNDYVILDTAGRLHIDETLMKELQEIKAAVSPGEILLVVDAMTGQEAVNVASSFNLSLIHIFSALSPRDPRGPRAPLLYGRRFRRYRTRRFA